MAFLREIVRLLNCSCEEITRLISESLDRDLPRSQRWAVSLHLLYCKACRRCRRQMRFLQEAVRQCLTDPDASEQPSITLPPEARKRIERAITQR